MARQRPGSHRPVVGFARTFVLFWLCAGGCSRILGYSDDAERPPIPQYADGAEGLRQLFADVLDAARRDDRNRVHDLLASTFMTEDDLRALFGPRAPALWPRYQKLMETLVNRGAVELVAQVYERKLDAVEVLAVDGGAPDAGAPERAVVRGLVAPLAIYSVRIKRATEVRGLRYDFFFYRNGKWRTGNQLGKFIE